MGDKDEEVENKKEEKERNEGIQKDLLKPVTKVNTNFDKELQDWEVDQLPVVIRRSG